jgi:hypothetical protein|tara:strand:+ start:119 stop:1534 length:1416 start_codon:yes stop_codon:yes gene_type:complete
MEMDRNQQRIEAAFLTKCTPQAAYDWLFEHRYTDDEGPPWLLAFDAPKVLEYLLVRRKDPLIDLGIARFGHSSEAIQRVFRRGDVGVRCSALSNAHIGPSGNITDGWVQENDIKEIIHNGTKAELESLVKNKFLDDDSLEQLIGRKETFAGLSDDQYVQSLIWLGSNPRMSAEYDRSLFDGWAEYSHGRVFSLAWELARHLPTTKINACVLYTLLQHTTGPVNYDNPEEVLERWRIEEEEEDGSRSLAYSYFLRTRLSDVLEADDKLLNSDDHAMRESFYRRFSPWEFKDWPTFIERDGELAFDGMVENDKLWGNAETRKLLSDLAWKVPDPHSSMNSPNSYNAVKERKRKQHPEWFAEEDAEYSNDSDAIARRVEKKLDKVVGAIEMFQGNYSQVNTEAKDITERVEQLLEHIEDSDSDSQTELRQELQGLRDELLEMRTMAQPAPSRYTSVPVWLLIVTIALLILILLK